MSQLAARTRIPFARATCCAIALLMMIMVATITPSASAADSMANMKGMDMSNMDMSSSAAPAKTTRPAAIGARARTLPRVGAGRSTMRPHALPYTGVNVTDIAALSSLLLACGFGVYSIVVRRDYRIQRRRRTAFAAG